MCCIHGICILAPGANMCANLIFHPVVPNQFNKYFTELVGKLSNDIPPSTSTPDGYFASFECPRNTLSYFKEVSEIDVFRFRDRGRSVIEGAHIHIFGFTNRENNQFQKKLMRQNLNI